MKQTIDVSQAIALNELGIDPVAYSTIGELLKLCSTPSEGEFISIRTTHLPPEWSLYYDNAREARFHKEGKELIDLLVEFTIWKAENCHSCLNLKTEEE